MFSWCGSRHSGRAFLLSRRLPLQGESRVASSYLEDAPDFRCDMICLSTARLRVVALALIDRHMQFEWTEAMLDRSVRPSPQYSPPVKDGIEFVYFTKLRFEVFSTS